MLELHSAVDAPKITIDKRENKTGQNQAEKHFTVLNFIERYVIHVQD